MSATPTTDSPPTLPRWPLARGVSSGVAYRAGSPGLVLTEMWRRAERAPDCCLVLCAEATQALDLAEELRWFDPSLDLAVFPDWETLPYDSTSPHQELVGERLSTLWRLAHGAAMGGPRVVLMTAAAAAQRLPPADFVRRASFLCRRGQRISPARLRLALLDSGYSEVSRVMAPGEFGLRGGIIDVFPLAAARPLRLDLLDDEIESAREFDPETQRSIREVEEVRLLPAHEFPFDGPARKRFREAWRTRFSGDPRRSVIYKDVGQELVSPGLEYWLPLFFSKTSLISDYLPDDCQLICLGNIAAAIAELRAESEERYLFLRHDEIRPALPPSDLWADAAELFAALRPWPRLDLRVESGRAPALTIEPRGADPTAALRLFINTRPTGHRILLCLSTPGRTERLSQLLREAGTAAAPCPDWSTRERSARPLMIATGPLTRGFELSAPALTVLTENELYASPPQPRQSRLRTAPNRLEAMIRDISELRPGDPVVHLSHGVGRYGGLQTKDTQDGPGEFLRLDYADGDRLFIPVTQLHLITRYLGADPEHAPLDKLGRQRWARARRKAVIQAHDTAAELLALYAARRSRQGLACQPHEAELAAFSTGFPFDETPDQAAAIAAVVDDLLSPRPMDRLVCGDVGFGKTEVALRAAFVAALSGFQVAVLCPTTLLARQHFETFQDRFADWPVRIAELSRFSASDRSAADIEDIRRGRVDIVIGTHKLLADGVIFARLGLLIIDEEHRFGVRQKEALKARRAEVNTLTLTATPIPRTLAMSLDGLRDFSVIATAPSHRLAVKTIVGEESGGLIREALSRELRRGGQVYYLHNQVATIEERAVYLRRLLPEARLGVAHGQMGERALEAVMQDFYRRKLNVLLCSSIIETGLDVPNANTIIIDRADRFGLAQLHQLRGRVGRSSRQAYAYLLVPSRSAMTSDARRRLSVLESLDTLGSGFMLARRDLEIRGAGEVLGEHQSGTMAEVGFELYNQLLNAAVAALKAGRALSPDQPLPTTSDISLGQPTLLPESYVPDVASRLSLYQRLATSADEGALDELEEALTDRFGPPPEPARALLYAHRLRLITTALGIERVNLDQERAIMTCGDRPRLEQDRLVAMLRQGSRLSLRGPRQLCLVLTGQNLAERVGETLKILSWLSQPTPAP